VFIGIEEIYIVYTVLGCYYRPLSLSFCIALPVCTKREIALPVLYTFLFYICSFMDYIYGLFHLSKKKICSCFQEV
jgi:hypothetical protein